MPAARMFAPRLPDMVACGVRRCDDPGADADDNTTAKPDGNATAKSEGSAKAKSER
ncbi:MAG: hypothetical protein GTO63_05475 [Anaerolineae bacterium]|nr:hypothetical protein [Anaerolineae bacterium]NIN94425.1 hypothetical protein [Anaerolineae bacterium]NIQ77488.1 hypothetical protein [Anaerolineae bacterium]